MKNQLKFMVAIFAIATLAFACNKARSETNQVPNLFGDSLTATNTADYSVQEALGILGSAVWNSPLLKATNYAFVPYLTYAPNVKSGTKWGGGLLACYNLNNYVAGAMGVDWLDRFSLVSANVTLKLDTKPLKGIGWLPESVRDVQVTPFVLAGVGSPLSGAKEGAATIYDVGANIWFGHWLGGRFGVGACYGEWSGAGDYSGKRYHFFLNWQRGF